MKAVILAGGLGTRLQEETHLKPKPMVEIGGKPILWHIMKIYSNHGIKDFIICCGYKGSYIKNFFANYTINHSDLTIDLGKNTTEVISSDIEDWKVTLVDTGALTMTGGRLKRVREYLKEDQHFCFTYGDGVSDVNISELIESHKQSGKLATLTATRPPGRFGALSLDGSRVIAFREKPEGDGMYVNGGFFVLSKKVIDLISGDDCTWEEAPLETLARSNQLNAFKHDGFWQPMDTIRDKNYLEQLLSDKEAPWKTW